MTDLGAGAHARTATGLVGPDGQTPIGRPPGAPVPDAVFLGWELFWSPWQEVPGQGWTRLRAARLGEASFTVRVLITEADFEDRATRRNYLEEADALVHEKCEQATRITAAAIQAAYDRRQEVSGGEGAELPVPGSAAGIEQLDAADARLNHARSAVDAQDA